MGKYAPRTPKERRIYSNYDLTETYPDEDMIECLIANGYEKDEITDELMWKFRYRYDKNDWEIEKERLEEFFLENGERWLLIGSVGRWDGVYPAGTVFETFDEFFYKATADCDYIHFYDENGHLYLRCSHHDGTCHYEIRKITEQGIKFLERWEENWDDKRSESYIHTQIMKRYSRLPQFARKIYGCKRFEYEPITKAGLIDKLNKQACSFYC